MAPTLTIGTRRRCKAQSPSSPGSPCGLSCEAEARARQHKSTKCDGGSELRYSRGRRALWGVASWTPQLSSSLEPAHKQGTPGQGPSCRGLSGQSTALRDQHSALPAGLSAGRGSVRSDSAGEGGPAEGRAEGCRGVRGEREADMGFQNNQMYLGPPKPATWGGSVHVIQCISTPDRRSQLPA